MYSSADPYNTLERFFYHLATRSEVDEVADKLARKATARGYEYGQIIELCRNADFPYEGFRRYTRDTEDPKWRRMENKLWVYTN